MQAGRAGISERAFSAAALVWGLALAFGLAVASGVVLGLAAAFSEWDAQLLLLQGVNYAIIVAGGFYAARRVPRLAWLHGGLVGVFYFLLASLALVPGFQASALVSTAGLLQLLLVFLAGALGGVISRLF